MKRSTFLRTATAFGACLATGARGWADQAPTAGPYPERDYRAPVGGRPGGTLRISVVSDSGTLDPHAQSHANVQWFGRILFDCLVYLDERGRPAPWLATSWTISPDGKTYTFRLRKDVTFSDGAKFDAAAVLVNLEHMRNPATRSPLAGVYIAPYSAGRVLDDHTVELTLRTPYSPFLNVLAQAWLSMQSPKAIRERPETLGYRPVGSGPFVLDDYTPQKGMTFRRRDDYDWSPPLIGHRGPAFLDRLEIEFVPDASVRYFSLASGEYDLTIDVAPQTSLAIARRPDLTLSKRIRMGCPNRLLAFNTARAPFDDVRIRRAVTLGLDRRGIAAAAGFGAYQDTTNFLSATTPDSDPSAGEALSFAPIEADCLLDQAGWVARDDRGYRTKQGRRLSASVGLAPTFGSLPALVEAQSDLRKIGVELKLQPLPLAQLLLQRSHANYDVVQGGVWHTNTPDALYVNYHSSQIPSPSHPGQNVSRLSDPRLDASLQQARETNDPVTQGMLYRQAQRRLIELLPAVPVYENESLVAFRNEVEGIVYDSSHETPHFETAWIKGSEA